MQQDVLAQAVELVTGVYRAGGKLLVCGNGGSAADSAHICGELMKGFVKKRPLPERLRAALPKEAARLQLGLPAIDLTAQSALLTAILNDQGGELVFAQQVLALGKPGDALLALSTSGNSPDVTLALAAARALGLHTLGLTGGDGGAMRPLCDVCFIAPCRDTARVQEAHLPFYHALCAQVEAAFFPE